MCKINVVSAKVTSVSTACRNRPDASRIANYRHTDKWFVSGFDSVKSPSGRTCSGRMVALDKDERAHGILYGREFTFTNGRREVMFRTVRCQGYTVRHCGGGGVTITTAAGSRRRALNLRL